jgi:hypothetical protein
MEPAAKKLKSSPSCPLPPLVYIASVRCNSVIAVESPTHREYTIFGYLQGAERLDYLPFLIETSDGGNDLVFKKEGECFRAKDLYNLLLDVAHDVDNETIDLLSVDFHSECPFEQRELEGMRKAVDLLGGFDALCDLSKRMTVIYMEDMKCGFVPTVFVMFDE